MAEDTTRLVAWDREMRTVHDRLRRALRLARDGLSEHEGEVDPAALGELTDPLLYCWGLCTALTGHHEAEDERLFPGVERAHPELAGVLGELRHDHHLIELILADLRAVLSRRATAEEIARHLDGLAAIMDSHFGFEERTLLRVLDGLDLGDASPGQMYGPLAEG